MSESNAIDIQRYSRQLLLPKWTLATQAAIEEQRLLIDPRYELALLYALAGGITKVSLSGSLQSESEHLAHCRAFQPKLNIASYALPMESSAKDCQVCLLPFSVWEQGLIEPCNTRHLYLLTSSSIYHNNSSSDLLHKMNVSSPMLESRQPALWEELASCLAIADFFANFANL